MGTQRLTDLEQRAWGGLLDTHTRLWRAMEAGLSATGVTMAEYDVLCALEQAGARGVRMSVLAGRRLMSTGGFTRLADRLEQQSLIQRRRCADDGRGLEAVITPAGLRLLRRARTTHLQDVRSLFVTRLSEAQLRELCAVWESLADPDGP